MPTDPFLHLEIALQVDSDSLAGFVRAADGEVREFAGVLDLIGLLDATLQDSAHGGKVG